MNWLKRFFHQKQSQQLATPPETAPSHSATSKKTTAGTKSSGKSKASAGKKRTTSNISQSLRILSHKMTQDAKSAEVEVTVKNVSSSTIWRAEIRLIFYMESDAGKFSPGTAYQVEDLAPGETRIFTGRGTWKYDTSGNPAKILRYKVTVLPG